MESAPSDSSSTWKCAYEEGSSILPPLPSQTSHPGVPEVKVVEQKRTPSPSHLEKEGQRAYSLKEGVTCPPLSFNEHDPIPKSDILQLKIVSFFFTKKINQY